LSVLQCIYTSSVNRWYTPDSKQSTRTCNHFSHLCTIVISMSRSCKQAVTACFTSPSAANHLHANWFRRSGWEVMGSPPDSSHLVPSDLHLYGHLKQHLVDKRLPADTDMKQADTCWVRTPDTEFFNVSIQPPVPRYHKCLSVNCDYPGVWCVSSATRLSCVHRHVWWPVFWNSIVPRFRSYVTDNSKWASEAADL
jgi:hypothetical protein